MKKHQSMGRVNRKPLAPLDFERTRDFKKDTDSERLSPNPKYTKLPPLKTGKQLDHSTSKDPGGFDPDNDDQKVLEKNYNIESVNPVEISKQILLDCNFIRPRNQSIPVLHGGDGHCMTLSDKSIREIYSDVYHKKVNTSIQ